MTIVQAKDLDRNDLRELGENVTEAIRIDHDAAVRRSLAAYDDEQADKDRVRAAKRWRRSR